MGNRRLFEKRLRSRLFCIEKKCDRILAELLILKQNRVLTSSVDEVIDRLHHSARRMRAQCESEYKRTNLFFNPKSSKL